MKTITRLAASALLFTCSATLASYISMNTEFSITETPDGPELIVTSVNRGDEPSYGVQFEVQAGGKQFTSAEAPRLAVNENFSESFPADGVFNLPGRYPVVIRTHYRDANAYPFSALTVGFYDHLQPVLSKIQMRALNADIPANGSSALNVVVRNNDSVPRDLEVVLHLPVELVADVERQSLQLAPGSEESLQFEVENFSALENSSYSVALIAQYEDEALHYSASGSAVARITAPSAMDSRWIWVFGGAGAIVLILLVVVIRRQSKRAPS